MWHLNLDAGGEADTSFQQTVASPEHFRYNESLLWLVITIIPK